MTFKNTQSKCMTNYRYNNYSRIYSQLGLVVLTVGRPRFVGVNQLCFFNVLIFRSCCSFYYRPTTADIFTTTFQLPVFALAFHKPMGARPNVDKAGITSSALYTSRRGDAKMFHAYFHQLLACEIVSSGLQSVCMALG